MNVNPASGETGECSAAPRFAWKRPFDAVLLLAAGVPFAPLWLALVVAVAIAIRLEDGGRIFYRQERVGLGGRNFQILKFRTMAEDSDRITRVGAVLRRLHIDELPQVLNIARGEMSLVGPRPEQPDIVERIERGLPSFADRLQVPPGIAGLAQLRGKYHTSAKNKLRYDRLYMANMSPLLDVKLIAMCVAKTLRTDDQPASARRSRQMRSSSAA